MRIRLLLCAACVLMLTGFVVVRADDKPADTPKKSETSTAKGRLTKPWSEMSDLTDDEKGKIKEIHSKALEDIKAIQEKEKSDIMALLTDDQKAEAQKLMDQAKSSSSGKKMKGDSSGGSSK